MATLDCKLISSRETFKNYAELLYKKSCLLCTIIRLQLNLKSYIHDDSSPEDNSAYGSRERKMSYHYYHQQPSTGEDPKSVLLSTLSLKQEFCKGNKASNLPKWFKQITELPPEERTSNDIQKMVSHLEIRKGDFLSKLHSSERTEFCRNCRHAWYEGGRIIIKAGHRGEFVYYIYSGTVSVTIKEVEDDVMPPTIKPGAIFGELSLLYDMRRTATIVCDNVVDVLYVDKQASQTLFPDKLQDNMQTKISSILKSGIFSDWLDEQLINLCIISKIEKCPYGHLVTENTIKSQFLYLVLQGRVEVMHKVETRQLLARPASQLDAQLPKLKLRATMSASSNLSSLPSRNLSQQCGYVSVDHIVPYSIVHLQSMFSDSNDVTKGLAIVSKGADVMRIPKLYVHSIATQSCWKSLKKASLKVKMYPSCSSLQRVYTERIKWLQYRSAVYNHLLDEKRGCPLANKPSSTKGTTLYKSPGILHQKTNRISDKRSLSECLSSSEPIHLHTKHTHPGWCLKTLPARWVPKVAPKARPDKKYIISV